MGKDSEKTTSFGQRAKPPGAEEGYGYSTTVEISRRTFAGGIPLEQRAYLEMLVPDEGTRVFELGNEEVTLGRSSDCAIQVNVENVSRRHARIFVRNEEYHIEDLGSTNGTYLNGVKIVRCALHNNDHIEIGGVKILFNEEKAFHRT